MLKEGQWYFVGEAPFSMEGMWVKKEGNKLYVVDECNWNSVCDIVRVEKGTYTIEGLINDPPKGVEIKVVEPVERIPEDVKFISYDFGDKYTVYGYQGEVMTETGK